jgi:hypothetical protein
MKTADTKQRSTNAAANPRPVIVSSFGPPALACIRSWGKKGFPVGMICIRREKDALPGSRYLTSFSSLDPKELYTTQGMLKIDAFLREFSATGIIAIQENISCWMNDNRQLITPAAAIWASSTPIIRNLLSKSEQFTVAQTVGFDLLPTYLIDGNPESIQAIPKDSFPICLRPDGPGTVTPGFKVKLAYSTGDLDRLIRQFSKIERPILAQPFMNMPNLVVHGSRTLAGNTIGLESFLVERKFQGVTLTIRPITMPTHIRQKCLEFVNRFEVTGCFHFEFLYDAKSGRAYFLEINGRLGGTTAKVYACGYDEPLMALESFGVCQFAPQKLQNIIVSGKHALLKYGLFALANRLTLLDYPIESQYRRLLKSLYALAMYKDEILSFSDIQGSIAFYRSLIKDR